MGACTSRSEIMKNAGEEEAPVEKEVVEVVANDAAVAEDGDAKQESLDNLLKDQDDEVKVSAVQEEDDVKEAIKPQETESPAIADEAQELKKNNEVSEEKFVEARDQVIKTEASEERFVEAEEVIKTEEAEASEETNSVVSEEAKVTKTEEVTDQGKPIEEEKPKLETSEPIKTEEKEEPKPLFKLWF